MVRPEKVEAVAEIRERLEAANAIFVTEFAGLTVAEQSALRRGLSKSDATYKVVKMSLAKRAAAELGMETLETVLAGPTGLAFTQDDPVPAAKALRDFANDHVKLVIKGVFFDGRLLPPEKVGELADIEPRDMLLAKAAGLFQAPMARLAGLVAALPRNAATMFQQLLDKRTAEAPQPAEPAPVEPEASEEPAADGEAPAVVDTTDEAAETGAADTAQEE